MGSGVTLSCVNNFYADLSKQKKMLKALHIKKCNTCTETLEKIMKSLAKAHPIYFGGMNVFYFSRKMKSNF